MTITSTIIARIKRRARSFFHSYWVRFGHLDKCLTASVMLQPEAASVRKSCQYFVRFDIGKARGLMAFAFMASPVLVQAEGPVFDAPADVAAITALEQRIGAQMDAKVLAEWYAPDALVVDYMVPGIYKGRAALTTAFDAQLGPVKSLETVPQESNIVSDGKFACVAMTNQIQYALKDGTPGNINLRQFDALEKVDGEWQIVQQHVAAPMDQKTGMAVLGGLPVRGAVKWTNMLTGPLVSVAQANREITQWADTRLRSTRRLAATTAYGPGGDDSLLYGEIAPGNLRGNREIAAYDDPMLADFNTKTARFSLLRVNSDGMLGAMIAVLNVSVPLDNGKVRRLQLRQMDCLQRVNGKWYSVEEMVSFPIDLATGKSVILPK